MKLLWPTVAAFTALAAGLSAAPAANSDAARVAILRYEDRTGTKNFEYMPGSLQEAITKSMHKKFEFVEVDPKKVEPAAAELRAKNKGKITPKEAAEICRKADIDILIYGNFVLNKADNEIEIHTEISLGSNDKFRVLKPVENRVDATIFGAAEKVASDIVTEITKVAQDQHQAKGKDPKEKKGKTQLGKTEKTKTWADMNWAIAIGAGPQLPLVSRDNADWKIDGYLNGYILRRLKNAWHVGLFGGWGSLRTQGKDSSAKSELRVGTAALAGGYFWDLSANWRLTSLIAAGYYFGDFSRYVDCSSNCSTSGSSSENFAVKNPFAAARAGIHYLLFSFLALGIEADYRMYFDSPKPVQAFGGSLTITGTF